MMAIQYRVADINHNLYFMIGDSVWVGCIHVAKVYANTIQRKTTTIMHGVKKDQYYKVRKQNME